LTPIPKRPKLGLGCDDRVETEQARPDTYSLVLLSRSSGLIRIGKLGMLHVQPGFYVYLGSALGPGGVRGRLAHHLQLSSRPHWHIDYLRAHATIEEIWYCLGRRRREHVWAYKLGRLPGAEVPLAGFGATDCRCESHLYFFGKRSSAAQAMRAIDPLFGSAQILTEDQYRAVGKRKRL